ncbi:MAG: glycosyltransferase family 2 protein [Actinomycetota bacterium]
MIDVVAGNRWDLLEPVPVDAFVPQRRVSLCVPVRDGGAAFEHLLTSLSVLRYPPALLEVVIVDDGSARPVERPAGLDPAVEVVIVRREPSEGFGASAARNAAAAAATGEIVVFVDADMIVAPDLLLAITRWFDTTDDAVVLGSIRFVASDVADGIDLGRELTDGDFGRRADDARLVGQEWRADVAAATRQFTIDDVDLYRMVTGAVLAVRRERFREIGGFREIAVRGIGDTEFGYRLMTNGAVLVPEAEAVAWHQGPATLRGRGAARADTDRRPVLASLVPIDRNRPPRPDPVAADLPVVAVAAVHIVGDIDDTAVVAAVERIRAIDGSDVVVDVVGGPAAPDTFSAEFAQVWAPPDVAWGAGTLVRILEQLSTPGVDVVRVEGQGRGDLVAATTRALRRHRSTPDPIVAAEATGRRHLAAAALDLTRLGDGAAPTLGLGSRIRSRFEWWSRSLGRLGEAERGRRTTERK